MRRVGLAVVGALAFVVVISHATGAFAQAGLTPAAHARATEHVPPSREEMAGIGCITAGAAAAMAAGAVGVVALAASGGAAASYANLALPVLGTAFAAGCGVGVLAAPGASWLIDHLGHVIYGIPEPN